MTGARYRFHGFVLDAEDRQLHRDGAPIALNSRYLDALVLLVDAGGRLVSKERFLDEVWRGVPVTDEALTQCIKTLRRQLGDDAARPRFIETVPKHGYRFVAPVEPAAGEAAAVPLPAATPVPDRWRRFWLLGGSGTLGAGAAGAIGGLFYGFAAAAQPVAPGPGALSVLLVLLIVTVALALAGGVGVAFGIAAAGFARARRGLWSVLGGAAGGLVVGAIVKLVGLDAFAVLLGQAPGDFTGAPEGALLGGAVGLGCWLAGRETGPGALGRGAGIAATAGAGAGLLIPLLGGRLLGGSLDLLARHVPASRLRLDPVGALFGEPDFGLFSQTVAGGLEGALFAGCIAAAMLLARRRFALDA